MFAKRYRNSNLVGADGTMVFLNKMAKNYDRVPVNKKGEFHFDEKS